MKLKSWHLYFLAACCFLFAFTALNLKYDKFYRVVGINNDNRALIELYLDEEEQEYLIDNAIAVNKFIDYITYDEFRLQNYSYYNALKQAYKIKDTTTLLNDVNNIVDRLSVEFGNDMSKQFNILIKNNLVYDFKNSTYFDFDNVKYYQLTRKLFNEGDYDYIAITNSYVSYLQSNEVKPLYQTFKEMVSLYDRQGLEKIMTLELNEGVQRMYTFDPLVQPLNNQTFIGSYHPKELTMISNIQRLNYSMYLDSEAYTALKEMYDQMYNDIHVRFIVQKAYTSYDTLSINHQDAGYSEYQLGTVVDLKAQGTSVQNFQTTEVYNWLLQHSYEYGYILRYPQEYQDITQKQSYTTFRYVGKDNAKILHDKNIPLEKLQEYIESEE